MYYFLASNGYLTYTCLSLLNHRSTQVDQYRTWAEDNNVLAFYSVSARSDSNVDMAVHTLLQHIVSGGLS